MTQTENIIPLMPEHDLQGIFTIGITVRAPLRYSIINIRKWLLKRKSLLQIILSRISLPLFSTVPASIFMFLSCLMYLILNYWPVFPVYFDSIVLKVI